MKFKLRSKADALNKKYEASKKKELGLESEKSDKNNARTYKDTFKTITRVLFNINKTKTIVYVTVVLCSHPPRKGMQHAWSMVKRLRRATNEYAPPTSLGWSECY